MTSVILVDLVLAWGCLLLLKTEMVEDADLEPRSLTIRRVVNIVAGVMLSRLVSPMSEQGMFLSTCYRRGLVIGTCSFC
ncbi:hypothetical protein BDN72DRAFT_850185 [Pluteus cervinus]|uniref:Uncharacterized protein n=1 Tax=Pluteus cervinus TaxID=181527 RepID=A0ACD3A5G6_9AGAR|nr:hypothetical protein BDN72DRAFT_850185 [Pluteus cervinus]